MSLFGGQAIPLPRRTLVPSDLLTLFVHLTELKLGVGVTLFGRLVNLLHHFVYARFRLRYFLPRRFTTGGEQLSLGGLQLQIFRVTEEGHVQILPRKERISLGGETFLPDCPTVNNYQMLTFSMFSGFFAESVK